MAAQINLLDEIIVDNFAGGGGASTGIELATGRPVTIAVNHDPDAILMHQTNHPYTEHYQASVWDIDPVEVCEGRPVGLAWFSPDCKHFSKAKGAKPVSKNIRGLAWIVLRWAGTVRPRVIILENVEEFQTWGPVRKGKPIKSRSGETFRQWLSQLKALGYVVDHRELVAADYGAPTTRKRFFLIARCDGKPIVWPEPTHGPADHPDVKARKLKPWRSAAEIIDWSIPALSIFATKEQIKEQYGVSAVRPLARNTMRRVARGLDKFVLKSAKPFIVPIGYGERAGQAPRVHDISDPMPTSVGNGKHYVCDPNLVQVNHSGDFRGQLPDALLPTITGKHGHGIVAPALIQYHTEQSEHVRGQNISDPIMTVDASNRYGLTAGTLVKYYGNDQHGQGANEPLHTVTAKDRALRTITACIGEFAAVHTTIEKYQSGISLKRWPQIRQLLNEHCSYHLADDEILLIWIGDTAYYLADIGLRMLTPRELYSANGFPSDYIIDRDYTGKAYGKSKQVARCGNAVPPPFATALVRANFPEWCEQEIETMEQFNGIVSE